MEQNGKARLPAATCQVRETAFPRVTLHDAMKVAITGGTGFVGPALVEEMLRAGHDVVVLEHKRPVPVAQHAHLTRVKGDVDDPASLREAFRGCDAVAHLVAIIREQPKKGVTFERIHVEGTRNVVEAAKAEGVRRFLLMSANGVESGVDTPYFRTKRQMEEMVKAAGFDWTIFRPSYIAADDPKGFDGQFADIVDKFPVLPSFGGGHFVIQPVARRNVAEAFTRALTTPESTGQVYTLVGPEPMRWKEYLHKLADLRGQKRVVGYVPGWAAIAAAKTLGPLFPADADQIKMMLAGNAGDGSKAVSDLRLDLETWEHAVEGFRRGRSGS